MPTNHGLHFGRVSFTGMARSHEKQRGLMICAQACRRGDRAPTRARPATYEPL